MARLWDPGLWVLVADGERARVMMPDLSEGQFRTVLRLGTIEGAHCPPPLRNESLDAARNRFVTDLARRLDDEAREGAYEELVLVAPGRVLHDVREAMCADVRARVVGTVMVDCAKLNDSDLSPLLTQWWRAPAEAV